MKKKKIYEGKILGLSVYDGIIEGRKVKREMIEHRGAAAILAFDEDKKSNSCKTAQISSWICFRDTRRNYGEKRRTHQMCL